MKPAYRRITIAAVIMWAINLAVFGFLYFNYGVTPRSYDWAIQLGLTAALFGLAWYFDRGPRTRRTPVSVLPQILFLVGMLVCTTIWVIWGGFLVWLAPVFAVAWAIHVRTWFRWRTARKVLREYLDAHAAEADAADPPVNVKVTLIDGREIAVDCVYMYTDESGMRRWRVITPLPAPVVGIRGEIPPRTAIHAG